MSGAIGNGERLWGVIPAAGIGSRFNAATPKQYAQLGSKTVLEHSMERLLALPELAGLLVALHPQDAIFSTLTIASAPRVSTVVGGDERAHSVFSALQALAGTAAAEDWVLVHDAARPCVPITDIQTLLVQAMAHDVGGLLAAPLVDTIKQSRVASKVVERTLDRRNLWRALTPQLFRYGALYSALRDCLDRGLAITDEASAMEFCGQYPLLVAASDRNIKITHPTDLGLAAYYMAESGE